MAGTPEGSTPADGPAPRPREGDGIDALIAEVRRLRRDLETDLTLAAAAVEQGETALGASIVDDERAELARMVARVDAFTPLPRPRAGQEQARPDDPTGDGTRDRTGPPLLLTGSADRSTPPARPGRARWRGLVPASALPAIAAAAAVVGLLAGMPVSQQADRDRRAVSHVERATSHYADFRRAAREGASAAEVIAAADRMHASLAPLLADPSADPAAALDALRLLELEQALLVTGRPDGADAVMAESRLLWRRLATVLPDVPELPDLPAVPLPSSTLPGLHPAATSGDGRGGQPGPDRRAPGGDAAEGAAPPPGDRGTSTPSRTTPSGGTQPSPRPQGGSAGPAGGGTTSPARPAGPGSSGSTGSGSTGSGGASDAGGGDGSGSTTGGSTTPGPGAGATPGSGPVTTGTLPEGRGTDGRHGGTTSGGTTPSSPSGGTATGGTATGGTATGGTATGGTATGGTATTTSPGAPTSDTSTSTTSPTRNATTAAPAAASAPASDPDAGSTDAAAPASPATGVPAGVVSEPVAPAALPTLP